jgi:AcrR family transcriptional regulator
MAATVDPDTQGARAGYRERLIDGLAAVLEEKGLSETTVADIVGSARVSKRTFYEHFESKSDCFAALILRITDRMLDLIATAVGREDTWEDRVRAAVRTHMETAASRPNVTRTLVLEVQAGGTEAMRVRREAVRRYADLFRRLSEQAAAEREDIRELDTPLATALTAGMNELMLEAVEEGRTDRLPEVVDSAVELIRAVAMCPPLDDADDAAA